MSKLRRLVVLVPASIIFFGGFFALSDSVFGSEIDHVVIDEIQISGAIANDEFIELYNPTDSEVNLEKWQIKRKTKTGSEDNVTSNIYGSIKPRGYFLIVPRAKCGASTAEVCYKGSVGGDDEYTTESYLAKNNSIALYDNNKNLIDKVGWGEAGDFEGEPAANLQDNQSLERKFDNGKVLDSDNNKNDFLVQTSPNPQNISSPARELPAEDSGQGESGNSDNSAGSNSAGDSAPADSSNTAGTAAEDGGAANDDNATGDNGSEGDGSVQPNAGNQDADASDSTENSGNNISLEQGNNSNSSEQESSGNGAENSNASSSTESAQTDMAPTSNSQNNSANIPAGNSGGQNSSSASSSANLNAPPKILITELLINPEDDDKNNEFIEVYNDGNKDTDLSGWILEDREGATKKFKIPVKTVLKSKKYKVFYSSQTGIVLNNSGDGATLKDGKGGVISETLTSDVAREGWSYVLSGGKWLWTLKPTPGKENIIKMEEKTASEESGNKKTSSAQNKTADKKSVGKTEADNNKKDASQSAEDSYDYSDGVVISEIFPDPKGRDNADGNYEWIELYNDSEKDVDLKGWQIDDILGKGSKLYIIKESRMIKAKSFLVFREDETKLVLNNPGDEVNILWPDGTAVDSVRYGKTVEGSSYDLAGDDSWFWSSNPTPGEKNKVEEKLAVQTLSVNNVIVEPPLGDSAENESEEGDIVESEEIGVDYVELEIDEAKKLPLQTKVKVTGLVSTPPGVFSDNSFYLFGSGIQVYSYGNKISGLNIGDKVAVLGTLSEVGGEKRIILDEKNGLEIISRGNRVEPKSVSTSDIGENVEGHLVTVKGRIAKFAGGVFFLGEKDNDVKIYIKPETGIANLQAKEGDEMEITGQVSRTSLGYRILPRFQSDIKINSAGNLAAAGGTNGWPLNYLALFLAGGLIFMDWGRMRIKPKFKKQRI